MPEFKDDQIPVDDPVDDDHDDTEVAEQIPLSEEEKQLIADSAPTEPFDMDA